ncbi:MAG: RNA polymerase factor sigma-54 [Phycisphaerae bacterium]|nr:RNA polymerase factor sigma-54 [Phycisphaerae bacterium]
MRLDMSQQMKMDQRMVLAPRMIQSMEILQLPLLALQERIEQELLSNPTLELEEPSYDEEVASEDNPDTTETEKDIVVKDDSNNADDFERMANQEGDFSDYMNRDEYIAKKRSSNEPDRKLEAMQNTAAREKTLHEHLTDQWTFIECDETIHEIGLVIIELINNNGYFTEDLAKIKEQLGLRANNPLEVSIEQVKNTLELIQELEPIGIAAKDLAQCLLLQLEADKADNFLEIELVKHHLKDIEMNRYPQIAKRIGCSIEDVKDAIKNISKLDPRPGLQFSGMQTEYIIPEIIVDYDEENDLYSARLADGSTPILKLNKTYTDMIKTGKMAGDAKEFLQNSVRSAQWLIESIQQRKATLMRVVNHVIKTQRDVFDFGDQHLKPLPMVEVAEKIGVHVGTVSRAVSGKYMQTPSGIFPLRYFFSQGTANADGESMSWDAIKAKLQEIVDKEDKAKPFNDDQLVEELGKSGITVARRTIAKYRGQMNIPPARRRKEY